MTDQGRKKRGKLSNQCEEWKGDITTDPIYNKKDQKRILWQLYVNWIYRWNQQIPRKIESVKESVKTTLGPEHITREL